VAGAAFAAACALGWIVERAFGLANPLKPVVDWLAPPPAWFALSVCVASGVSLCVLLARALLPFRSGAQPGALAALPGTGRRA